MKSASDALGIAPSGLSDSVKVLENRFGTALLIRHKTGVTPTTEGERVYASASGIVDLLNEALGPDDTKDLARTCRLSVPTEVASTCLGPVLRQLAAKHPSLELKVFAEDELIDQSRFARDYFIRIAPNFAEDEALRTIWTGKAKAILVASTGLVSQEDAEIPGRVATLAAIVGAERKPPFGYPLQAPKGRITFQRAIGASSPAVQLAMACQGLGVTGCLDICAAAFIREGALRQVLSTRFEIPLEVRLMTPHRRKMRADAEIVDAMKLLTAHG